MANKDQVKKRKLSSLARFTIGKEREYFVENLSMLVASGMSITTALHGLESDVKSRGLKNIILHLADEIDGGSSLWRALDDTKLFPEYSISLIRVGEESGRLSENLRLVAEQESKDRVLKSKISSAMMYPALVLGLTVVIGAGIAWFILPRLSTVFDQLQLELPLITQILIKVGNFLGEYGKIVVPAFLFGILLIGYIVFSFKPTKFIGEFILFHFPGVKDLLREVELARFGYLLGTLLNAGLPVTQALESLENATVFRRYKKFYQQLRLNIADGNSFQTSFENIKKIKHLIPSPVQQLIVAGEQSGSLAETLLRVSTSYEQKTENTTKNLSVILEPIMLVIVWLGVVSVALAVILPIYNLIGGLTGGPSVNTPAQSAPVAEEASVVSDASFSDVAVAEVPVENEVIVSYPKIKISDQIDFLNIRRTPDSASVIVGKAAPGEIFEFSSESEGWYQIILTENETGWVYGEYVVAE